MDDMYDLLIVGGGINGTAIARDAAGRGLSVLLCEKDDLASHTSSASTKLIHGGLRYLEYYEFKLVRDALIEREVLLRSAPHIIWPMRFILPYDEGLRPAWMLRLGLLLYDNLGGRKLLPGTKKVNLEDPEHQGILKDRLKIGFEYSDCWVDDARFVVLNAMDAREKGADIRTRTEVINMWPEDDHYGANIRDAEGERAVRAKGIVNAAGPWVEKILLDIQPDENDAGMRLIKGSHIVVPKLFEGEHAYMFQNADNRIIFAIPYEQKFTLIGTTDVPQAEQTAEISQEEIEYLCQSANEYLKKDISPDDVVWSYSGVRPLYDDKSENASAVTRDYVLDIDEFATKAPFMSIYGGKITTSRKLAQHAMKELKPYFSYDRKSWTAKGILPGGNIKDANFDDFFEKLSRKYPWMQAGNLRRMARAYGTHITKILGEAKSISDLGQHFGGGLTEAEVRYLREHEWARAPRDVLWRRSKLGLHMTQAERDAFSKWFLAFQA